MSNPSLTVAVGEAVPTQSHGEIQWGMPPLLYGMGTFRMPPRRCVPSIVTALECGVRLFDTAESYRKGIDIFTPALEELNQKTKATGSVTRKNIFIIHKLSKDTVCRLFRESGAGSGKALTQKADVEEDGSPRAKKGPRREDANVKVSAFRQVALELTADAGGYIDLLLLHWPGTCAAPHSKQHALCRLWAWREMIRLRDECPTIIRQIGVSNFEVSHLQEIIDVAGLEAPAVNQVECHPYNQQRSLRHYCALRGIHVQAYTSLGRCLTPPRCLYGHTEPDYPRLVVDPVVAAAVVKPSEGQEDRKGARTPQGVLLAWAMHHGLSVLPMSSSDEHIVSNFSECERFRRGDLDLHQDGTMDRLDALRPPSDCGLECIHYAYAPHKRPA